MILRKSLVNVQAIVNQLLQPIRERIADSVAHILGDIGTISRTCSVEYLRYLLAQAV